MGQSKNYLFPYVLEALRQRPQMSDRLDNLLKHIMLTLKNKNVKINNLSKDLDATINMGKTLGILTVQDGEIRIPFLLKGAKPICWTRQAKNSAEKSDVSKRKLGNGTSQYKEKPEPVWINRSPSPAKSENNKHRSRTRSRSRTYAPVKTRQAASSRRSRR